MDEALQVLVDVRARRGFRSVGLQSFGDVARESDVRVFPAKPARNRPLDHVHSGHFPVGRPLEPAVFMGVKVNGRHDGSGQNAFEGNLTWWIVCPVFFCFYPDKERVSGKFSLTLGILLRHVSLDCLCSVAAHALVLCIWARDVGLFRPLGVQLFSRSYRFERMRFLQLRFGYVVFFHAFCRSARC